MEELKKASWNNNNYRRGFIRGFSLPGSQERLGMNFDVALDNNWDKISIQDIISSTHGHFQVRIKNAQRTVCKPGT